VLLEWLHIKFINVTEDLHLTAVVTSLFSWSLVIALLDPLSPWCMTLLECVNVGHFFVNAVPKESSPHVHHWTLVFLEKYFLGSFCHDVQFWLQFFCMTASWEVHIIMLFVVSLLCKNIRLSTYSAGVASVLMQLLVMLWCECVCLCVNVISDQTYQFSPKNARATSALQLLVPPV